MNPNPKRAALGLVATLAAGCLPCGIIPCDDIESPPRDTGEFCESRMNSYFPVFADAAVYYRTSIYMTFEQPEPDATFEVRAASGAIVNGEVSWSEDQKVVTFTPTTPLTPNTTYEVEVSYSCDKTFHTEWTTSAAGAPVDPAAVEGGVYAFDLSKGRVVTPESGILLSGLVESMSTEDAVALISMTSTQETSVGLRIAAAARDATTLALDVCYPTVDHVLSVDLSASPYFELETAGWEVFFLGAPWSVDALRITGAFVPDGSAIEGVTVDALLDIRSWEDLVGPDVCQIAEIAGLVCAPCSDGEVACLTVTVDRLSMARVSTDGLPEILQADVDSNPECSAL